MQDNSEEYLRKHLEKLETKSNSVVNNSNNTVSGNKMVDLQYVAISVSELPCGIFYPIGTFILIRPLTVPEIQAFSFVQDGDAMDIADKTNEILLACVRIKYPDGTIGSYLDIKEMDRICLLFKIREISIFDNPYSIKEVKCACNNSVSIECCSSNFKYFNINEKLAKFLSIENYFEFNVKGRVFKLTMPNIGFQKNLIEYIREELKLKKEPNAAFVKIISYLSGKRNNWTVKEIKDEIKKFESLSMDEFNFLNSAVDKMKFGIENLSKQCPVCGEMNHTELEFEKGIVGIFVDQDAFEKFIS